jgi:hypothetical protein
MHTIAYNRFRIEIQATDLPIRGCVPAAPTAPAAPA